MRKTNQNRIILLLLVALAHGAFILFFVIKVDAVNVEAEPSFAIMKITDLAEELPPPPPEPPPPPPPPREPIPEPPENAVEAIAETMIETEEEPEDQVVVAPGALAEVPPVRVEGTGTGEYLSMHEISVAPRFSEREILRALVYPAMALRAGIEGTVYLELFIDKTGTIQRIVTLRENPEGRGFGDAAKAAFQKLRCSPAEANGVPVAVRYRYPVRFTIRN